MAWARGLVALAALAWWAPAGQRLCCGAERLPAGVKTLTALPRSEIEIITAFEQARGQACEQVAPGEPVELKHFMVNFDRAAAGSAPFNREAAGSTATAERRAPRGRRDLPVPAARRCALTLGLDVSRADQSQLPLGSANLIMGYIHEHYVAIEARVYRDLADDAIYLGSRPLAVVGTYRGARLTQEFVETTAASVGNIRGVGLWLRPGQSPRSVNLRTAVFLHKDLTAVESAGHVEVKPNYEWVFVRARPRTDKEAGGVELHAFVTSEQRRRLNYLRASHWPTAADECSVKGTIVFTDYHLAKRIPSAAATRSFVLRARGRFSFEELNAAARKSGWTGDALDNLTDTLDAIIDGKIEK